MKPPVIAWREASEVRFPATCAECGAAPSNGYRLRGLRLDVRVPLCTACDARKTRGVALWVAGSLAGTVAGVVLLSVFLELVIPFPEEHGPRATVGALIALVLLAAAGVALFMLLRRSVAAYHRLRSPVFVLGESEGVSLAFRNDVFAEATRALMDGAQPGYRRAPAVAFVAPQLPSYWPAVGLLAWGIGTLGAGVARYREVSGARGTVMLRSVENIAYALAGAPGIAVFYLVAAVALIAGGVVVLRSLRRTRAALLGSV